MTASRRSGTASVVHLQESLAAEDVALDDQALRELAGVGVPNP